MKAERQQREPQQAEPIQSKREGSKLSFVDNRIIQTQQAKMIRQLQFQTIQRKRYPTSGSGRIIKPRFSEAIQNMDYFMEPQYTSSGIKGAGGKHSSAILGPTGSYLGKKSDADSKLPEYITEARIKYPESFLKAGHLLNAQFGGDGKNSNNLTILSATGNANHKAYDEPVKKALKALKQSYKTLWDDGIVVENLKSGVSVDIKVDTDLPWNDESKIFKSLTCSAEMGDFGEINNEFTDEDLKAKFQSNIENVVSYCSTATTNGEIIDNPVEIPAKYLEWEDYFFQKVQREDSVLAEILREDLNLDYQLRERLFHDYANGISPDDSAVYCVTCFTD